MQVFSRIGTSINSSVTPVDLIDIVDYVHQTYIEMAWSLNFLAFTRLLTLIIGIQ